MKDLLASPELQAMLKETYPPSVPYAYALAELMHIIGATGQVAVDARPLTDVQKATLEGLGLTFVNKSTVDGVEAVPLNVVDISKHKKKEE